MTKAKAKITVAISGGGRSLENLINYNSEHFEIVAIIASRECRGIEVAKNNSITNCLLLYKKEYQTVESTKTIYEFLARSESELVILAGYLKLFPLHKLWHNKIINIHPALLPNFGGKGMHGDNVHKAVINSGVKESGATIHYVNEKYDDGAIISQIKIPVKTQSYQQLAKKVFAAECKLLPLTIDMIVNKKLPLQKKQILQVHLDV